MNENIKTVVLDAGARFGLHPTWKKFSGELQYYLFEPDDAEAKRLKKKYAKRSDEIKVEDYALNDENGKIRIYFLKNRAMSTSCERNPISASFLGERKREVEIVDNKEVDAITIDSFCKNNNISLDFLKIDTEGTEYKVLQGAKTQLKNNVLGIRCEVNFDRVFKGMPVFSKIHDFMLENDFYLLNLGYDGKGEYCNEFVNANGRYGILTDTDGVWLKRRDILFNPDKSQDKNLELRVMKYAAFCLNNDASDVALDVLLQARREHGLNFDDFKHTRLYKSLDISVQKLFYSLKWQPGQSLKKHKDIYFEIFNKKMKELHEYNESLELNPD